MAEPEQTRSLRTWADRPGRVIAGIVALAVIVRLLLIALLDPSSPVGDMGQYIRLASGAIQEGTPESTFRAPAYPLLLAIAFIPGGDPILAGCILNVFLSAIAVILVAIAGGRLLSPGWGLAAACLLAIEPAFSLYSTMVLTEVASVMFVASAIAGMACLAGWRAGAVAGLCIGLGALTRDSIALFIPFAALVAWRSLGARSAVVLCVTALLTIVPWTARNLIVTGRPILISTGAGYNLLVGNNPYADGSQRAGKRIFHVDDPPVPEDLDPVERHIRGMNYAVGWVAHHPVAFAVKGARGAIRMFGLDRQFLYALREGYYATSSPPRPLVLLIAAAVAGAWVLLLPVALVGVAASKKGLLRQVGIAALAWTLLVGALAFGEWRFRAPMLPVFVLLAVEGIRCWRAGMVKRRHLLAAGIALVPVVLVWVSEVLERAGDVL